MVHKYAEIILKSVFQQDTICSLLKRIQVVIKEILKRFWALGFELLFVREEKNHLFKDSGLFFKDLERGEQA